MARQQRFESDLFVSHSSVDTPTIKTIVARLEKDGFKVFFDQNDMSLGQPILARVRQALRSSRLVLLCHSRYSADSDWVALESLFASRYGNRILLLRLDDSPIPVRHTVDLYRPWSPIPFDEDVYQSIRQSCEQSRQEPSTLAQFSPTNSDFLNALADMGVKGQTSKDLLQLAVFTMPFDELAAAKVLGVSLTKVRAKLRTLVEKEALQLADHRYSLNQVLRTHLLLTPPLALDDARRKHALYFWRLVKRELKHLAETQSRQSRRAERKRAAHERLIMMEYEIIAVLEYFGRKQNLSKHDLKTLLDLTSKEMADFFNERGVWGPRIRGLQSALKELEKGSNIRSTIEVALQLADVLRRSLQDFQEAIRLYKKSQDTLGESHPDTGHILRCIADTYRVEGNLFEAANWYERARKKKTAKAERGKLLSSLADLYVKQHLGTKALKFAQQSLTLAGKDGYEVAQSHRMIADAHIVRGRPADALEAIRSASNKLDETDNWQSENPLRGWIWRTWGDICRFQHSFPHAEEYYRKALSLFEKTGVRRGVVLLHDRLALLYLAQGNVTGSCEHLRIAFEMADDAVSRHPISILGRWSRVLLDRATTGNELKAIFK